jgi:hypothetical protein
MLNFVIYEGRNEVLITTIEREHECLKEWFAEGDRHVDHYDRSVIKDSTIQITTTIDVDV